MRIIDTKPFTNAAELRRALSDILGDSLIASKAERTLCQPSRLLLVEETLTDGSKVLNLDIVRDYP